MRIRDLGYAPGTLPTGPLNSVLDVSGVGVGQVTIHEGQDVHTGVTVILPRPAEEIQTPCYAGIHTLNGAGEVTGSFQIRDWGFTNCPLIFTNSVALGKVYDAVWHWSFKKSRERGQSTEDLMNNFGSPVVGETCDWFLHDMQIDAVQKEHVFEAFEKAESQNDGRGVLEGSYGGGTGTQCSQFKGGTGTASRVVKAEGDSQGKDSYTVGVIVQTNHGLKKDLIIGGVPIGELLIKEEELQKKTSVTETKTTGAVRNDGTGGSILVVIITDAPLLPHQLTRLAQCATIGVSCVTRHGVGLNPSGDIFLALSTGNAPQHIMANKASRGKEGPAQAYPVQTIRDNSINTLFYAVAEATEEAILNSMVGARDGLTGYNGNRAEGLPVERVKELLEKNLIVV